MGQRVVIIGGVAAGPKAACRLKRLDPSADVTIVEQDRFISYGGCGIPFYISDDIPNEKELMSTSFHVIRDEKFFLEGKGVKVLTRTKALNIDRSEKKVEIENLDTGEKNFLKYDKLVLATGSIPNILPIPGSDLGNVFTVSNINSALKLKSMITRGKIEKAVIIGGGAIGIEMAEAISDMWEIDTTIVEYMDHLLPFMFDYNFAQMVKAELEKNDVKVYVGERVESLKGDSQGNVCKVITNNRTLDTDLVIMCVGVRPNDELARKAGLAVGDKGGILVDKHLCTSDPFIYAGGDCILNTNLLTGKRMYLPLGSLANRHGRVIGSNLAGKPETFDEVVGSFIIKVFDICAGSAGLSLESALLEQINADRVLTVGYDRAHYYPTRSLLYLQLVVDKQTRRILGFQAIGDNNDAVSVRLDSIVALMQGNFTVDKVSNLEIAYSPPYASAMDSLNALGNTAANFLDGLYKRMEVKEFLDIIGDMEKHNAIILDSNAEAAAKPYVDKFGDRWLNIPYMDVRRNIEKIPRDKKIITICDSGIRSYEIQLLLNSHGYEDVICLEGGLNLINKMGIKIV